MRRKKTDITINGLIGILTLSSLFVAIGCQEFAPYQVAADPFGSRARISPSTVLAPDPQDAKFLDVLGTRADTQLAQCQNPEACTQAHFVKALTTLHANTKVAAYHFQQVMEASPHHRLSQASRVWLWLLDELPDSQSQPVSVQDLTRELIQALLERDLRLLEEPRSGITALSPDLTPHLLEQEAKIKSLSEHIHELSQEVAALKTESTSIRSLQKELQARNEKVAELTSQLDALRRIDQELKEKATPTTPSENILTPKEEPRDNP